MTKKKAKKPKDSYTLLVNRKIFLASMTAIGVLMEDLAEQMDLLMLDPEIDNYLQKMLLSIIGRHLEAVGSISSGFEASLDTSLKPDKSKGFIN